MTHVIRMHEPGGPEVLRWETLDVSAPGPGEVRVKHTAVGLNFVDTYYRSGLYPAALPTVLGSEGAGVVEAVGAGVRGFAPGDHVAYGTGPLGAYAEARNVPADVLVEVPNAVEDRVAAASMLKGMTAHYLLELGSLPALLDGPRAEAPPIYLVHAAAGGVGTLLCQWAKHRGAFVIGTVGSEAKAEVARSRGCDAVILYRTEQVSKRVAEITGGRKVDVVFDAVGKDTFEESLASLRPRGLMVSYGQASGPIPAIAPLALSRAGSLFLTRPVLADYVRKEGELARRARDLFDAIAKGHLVVPIAQSYPLKEAAKAHADLAARRTTGSTLLLP